MSIVKQISKNFFWLFCGEFFNGLFSFIIVVYLARVLGVENFGLLNFAQAILIYLLLFVDAGFSTYGTREVARSKEKASQLAINIIIIKIIMSITIYLLSIIVVSFLPIKLGLKFLFAATFLLVISKNTSPEWIFQGIERFEYSGLEKIATRAILVVFIFLLVKNANDLVRVPLLEFIVGGTIALIFIFQLFSRHIPLRLDEIKRSQWRQYFIDALPLGVSYLLLQIYFCIDTVMLGLLNNLEGVGFYNAAYKIIYALLIFATVLGKSIFPTLSKLYHDDINKMKNLVSAIFNYSLFLAIPIAIGGMILSEQIITLVFGPTYYPAAWAFRLLIFKIITVYTSAPFSFSLLAAGRQKDYLSCMAVGSVLNVVANIFLIPHYGFVGAAIASIITEIVVWVLIFYYLSKNVFYVRIQNMFLKYLAVAAIMGAFIFYAKTNIILSIIGAGVIYFSLNLLFGFVSLKELIELFRIQFGCKNENTIY
jgi:O-antigen/teichoic acid export membrane protein